MLGIIHRSVLGLGPEHFRKFFKRAGISRNPNGRECAQRHSYQLETFRRWKYLDIVSNSLFGLIDVYNLLPAYIVSAESVKDFQGRLQALMKELASTGEGAWDSVFCPRKALHSNQLRQMFDWEGACPNGSNNEGVVVMTKPIATRMFAF